MNQYTAVVKQDGECWIGWIEQIPGVNCQEQSRDELLETLRVTLQEATDMNSGKEILEGIARGERAIIENRNYSKAEAKDKMKRWLG